MHHLVGKEGNTDVMQLRHRRTKNGHIHQAPSLDQQPHSLHHLLCAPVHLLRRARVLRTASEEANQPRELKEFLSQQAATHSQHISNTLAKPEEANETRELEEFVS